MVTLTPNHPPKLGWAGPVASLEIPKDGFSICRCLHEIKSENKWMLATAGSCLSGLFGVQRPPRQILVVRPTHQILDNAIIERFIQSRGIE